MEGDHSPAINAEEWVDPYLYSPHALTEHRPNFNFTLSYVHICCLISKNRNIRIHRPSCACMCVQLGLSHYRKNLGWWGSTTGY